MTSTNQTKKKLKILCLHGFGTNKEFMKMQTQAFRKDFEDMSEFIFVDAPYIVPIQFVLDPKVLRNLEGPPRSWIYWKTGRNYFVIKTKQGQISRHWLPLRLFANLLMKHLTTMMEQCAFLKGHKYFR